MSMDLLANYNWQAALVFVVAMIAISKGALWLLLKVPALREVAKLNEEQDKVRLEKAKYPPMIGKSNQVGLITNLIFVFLMVPFVTDFEARSGWMIAFDALLILAVYDLGYYVVHRFLFHAPFDSRFAVLRYFRRVHAVHHQARDPSRIDAYYVHPVETFMGQELFHLAVLGLGLFYAPFHIASVVIAGLIYVNMNLFNHVKFEVPGKRYALLNWISLKHHNHHIDMSRGNYATVSLFYDKIFGTLD